MLRFSMYARSIDYAFKGRTSWEGCGVARSSDRRKAWKRACSRNTSRSHSSRRRSWGQRHREKGED